MADFVQSSPARDTSWRSISAYDKDADKAALICFDRESGEPVSAEHLQSYEEALAQFYLHPEAKFHNGDYLDSGVTLSYHVGVTAVEHIGKETSRWEEQICLGPEGHFRQEATTNECFPFSRDCALPDGSCRFWRGR